MLNNSQKRKQRIYRV